MKPRRPSEKSIVAKGMAIARSRGYYAVKLHGSAFSLVGIPDVMLLKEGRAYFIEFKRPGEEPTKIQQHRLRELIGHGCPSTVCRSAADVEEFLEAVG